MALSSDPRISDAREHHLRVLADGAPPAPGWVFILGLPRSGTTVLSQLLNAHPDAAIAQEAWLWGFWDVLTAASFDLRLFDSPLATQRRIENSRMLNATGSCDAEGSLWRASRLREFFEGLRRAVAPGVKVFGDKGPHYRRHLGEVMKVFPDCKLVLAVRNSWDRAASMMDWEWFRSKHSDLSRTELAQLALDNAKRSLADADDIASYDVYRFPFEGMATEPRKTLSALLAYLELEPDHYDWDYLRRLRYAQAMNHWQRVPEIAALREREAT